MRTDPDLEPTRSIDRATARRFLVTRHLLSPPRSLPAGPEGVLAAIDRLGSIQFDPLAVAGRNHDLVLHARVHDYDPAWTDALLYDSRELFEIWNKGLCLVPSRELPYYRIFWDTYHAHHSAGAWTRYGATVDLILSRIRAEGPLSSVDFEPGPKIPWGWGPTNETRAMMEALADAGVLGLARREGNRRYLDLVERLFPDDLLARRPGEREQRRHKLLSRYRANGLLGDRGSPPELWMGTGKRKRTAADPPDLVTRDELRDALIADGEIWPIAVDGLRGVRYVLGEELDLLEEVDAAGELLTAPAVSFIGPLDPLIWDRDLVRDLFDFDYLWEVYTPEPKRRWGYYVLPILFGERFVGRIEPRIDRATGTVKVLGCWWEDGFDPATADGFVDAIRDCLADYLRFASARSITWAPGLGREKRLFGTRPRATSAAASPAADW
jgi:uncharacterized protein YcaQ